MFINDIIVTIVDFAFLLFADDFQVAQMSDYFDLQHKITTSWVF